MTSMGEISAASMTTATGSEVAVGPGVGDLRRALTTSFTPRLRVLALVATNMDF